MYACNKLYVTGVCLMKNDKGVKFIEGLCFSFKMEIDPEGINGMSIDDLQYLYQKIFECRRGLFKEWLKGQKAKNDYRNGGWKQPAVELLVPYSIRCARNWRHFDAVGCPVRFPVLRKLTRYNRYYVAAFCRSQKYGEKFSVFEPMSSFPFDEFEQLIRDDQNPQIWKFMEKDEIWDCYHSYVPKSNIIYQFDNQLIASLKGKFKFFLRGLRSLKNMHFNMQKYSTSVKSLAELVALHGQKWESRVKRVYESVNAETIDSYRVLTRNRSEIEIEFLDYWAGRISKEKLLPIFSVIKDKDIEEVDNYKSSAFIKELSQRIVVKEYGVVKDVVFALECAKHKIPPSSYPQYEMTYLEHKTSGNSQMRMPNLVITDSEYRIRVLPKDDIRGLFLGNYTNCCQKMGGYSQDAALHGMFNENGCFVVVEKDESFLFQSWTWINGKAVVFDNVEAYVGVTDEDKMKAKELYYRLANSLVTSHGYSGVYCGCGNADLRFDENTQIVRPCSPPSNVHVYDSNACWSLVR